ncbi:MAG: hypothetical protein V4582_10390 [Pseudomonadota bacterium]
MRRQHPKHQMDIPISLEVYHQLLVASGNTGYEMEDWEIAAQAIDEWMRRHAPDTIPMPATKGYQWKQLFLPVGTLLRTVFGGKNHHCVVEGDQILFNGQTVSPSGFVNAIGGIRRNAWRCTWILFPESKEWKLADTLRTRERPHRDRKHMGVARAATAGPSCPEGRSAPIAHVADPTPAQAIPFVTGEFAAPSPQSLRGDKIQEPDSNSNDRGRPERTDTSLSPPRCRRGADRRNGRTHSMSPWLPEQLLPLLVRMCAFDEDLRKTHTRPYAARARQALRSSAPAPWISRNLSAPHLGEAPRTP